jgi:hypothetical protein
MFLVVLVIVIVAYPGRPRYGHHDTQGEIDGSSEKAG